ncbi:hypothetical protein F4778DRAFT_799613 [Xylariomycetidae sp. FL2044]|nr:hypothetical protein F4778DRAFT_799613 [Xylariomycetidae sp. FL2044]
MLFLLVLLCSTLAAGAALMRDIGSGLTTRTELVEGYSLVDMSWTGPIVAGGQNHTFHGTFEVIENQALENGGTIYLNNSTASTGNGIDLQVQQPVTYKCLVGLSGPANAVRIDDGIKFVRKAKGECAMPAGPRVCGRISCSYGSAIYWCNDNDHLFSHQCSDFATYAQTVRNYCTYSDFGQLDVWGQIFDDQNFNVMVGSDKC